MRRADLVVTNFNPRFTGVSATAAGIVRRQMARHEMALLGHPLPGGPAPLNRRAGAALAKAGPARRPFQIWHVRRNPEMQMALWLRDVRRLPIRIVFTSAAQRLHSRWPRWLISRMDAVIATTEEAARFVPNTAAVVPHGVDTARFFPPPEAGRARRAGRVMATIGRVRPEKGTDRFVEMALRLLPQMPDLEARIVGLARGAHRSFRARLEARIAAAGLSERIRFVGEVPPEEMPRFLREIDLLVALPRYEGYGMTPLEAMATAVPVVASDTGYFARFLGAPEGGGVGAAGEIIAGGDPAAAAEAARRILSDGALHARMGAAALARARGQFSIEAELAGIEAVYARLWEMPGRPTET